MPRAGPGRLPVNPTARCVDPADMLRPGRDSPAEGIGGSRAATPRILRPRFPITSVALTAGAIPAAILLGAPATVVAALGAGVLLGAAGTAGATLAARPRSSGTSPAGDEPRPDADDAAPGAPADTPSVVDGDGHLPAALAAARAELRRLSTAIDASDDAVRLLDADGRIEWVNRVATARAGRRIDELRGHEAFGPASGFDLDEDTAARLAAELAGGATFYETLPQRTLDDRRRWVDVRARPVHAADGTRSGWVVIERDVTAGRERADLLDLVLESAQAGMWDWDVPSGTVRTTAYMHRMIDEPEPCGPVDIDWFMSRVHPDDAPELHRRLDRSLAEDESFEVEFRFGGHEGRWTWIRTSGRVIARDAAGQPVRMIGLHVDVDRMHRAVLEARETTALLNAIIDLVPVRIFWKDAAGRYLGANDAFRKDCGDHPLVGLTDRDLDLDPEERGRRRERDHQILAGAETSPDVVEPWTRPDGVIGWRHTAYRPLRDAEGATIGVIGSYQDVTELQHVAEELERARDHAEAANLAKSEFLANMSHEIRTPMTAILGFADMLEEAPGDEAGRRRQRDAIDTIRRNGHQLLAILNDILDLSKIEAGRLTVERLPVRPATLVGDVVHLLRPRAEGKGLGLRVEVEGPLPAEIATDPVRMRQILTNLVGNAIKFTETGEVAVHLAFVEEHPVPGEVGGRLVVRVRDTGIGMTPEQAGQAFEAFAQADTSTSRRFGGTGLGLRISRSLAEALGGRLDVETGLGEGSTFTVEIDAGRVDARRLAPAEAEAEIAAGGHAEDPCPVADGAADVVAGTAAAGRPADRAAPVPAPRSVGGAGEGPLAGRRILLAEDGPDNQRLIGFHLRKAGAEAVIVDDGRQAVDAVEAAEASGRPFDLVLMDVQMPVLDGYGAVRELRAAGHVLPILALTAHAMAGDRDRSLEAGCDEHLTKPIDRAALVAAIAERTHGHDAGEAEGPRPAEAA